MAVAILVDLTSLSSGCLETFQRAILQGLLQQVEQRRVVVFILVQLSVFNIFEETCSFIFRDAGSAPPLFALLSVSSSHQISVAQDSGLAVPQSACQPLTLLVNMPFTADLKLIRKPLFSLQPEPIACSNESITGSNLFSPQNIVFWEQLAQFCKVCMCTHLSDFILNGMTVQTQQLDSLQIVLCTGKSCTLFVSPTFMNSNPH